LFVVALIVLLPLRTKIVAAVLASLALAAVLFNLSQSTLDRLSLIIVNPAEVAIPTTAAGSAVSSQLTRIQLQKRAFELTLRHPLLGVGAEMFEDAVDSMVREETGRKSGWQDAHNTYLQVAAENGIPAAILFVATMIMTFTTNLRAYRLCGRDPALADARPQSLCLLMATLVYGFGIVFSNSLYASHLPVLLGLSAANSLALERQRQSRRAAAARVPR
jgi:O-antigen ligase